MCMNVLTCIVLTFVIKYTVLVHKVQNSTHLLQNRNNFINYIIHNILTKILIIIYDNVTLSKVE